MQMIHYYQSKAFNGFDKNLKFTVDRFEKKTTHFLDLEICPNGLTIFQKTNHTRQYINVDSFTLWKQKTTWIKSLAERARKECSKENLPKELQLIKKFASWNGYPKNIASAIIKRVLSKETSTNDVTSNEEKDKILTVFINIDYPGEKGEHLLKKSFKGLGRSSNQKSQFRLSISRHEKIHFY